MEQASSGSSAEFLTEDERKKFEIDALRRLLGNADWELLKGIGAVLMNRMVNELVQERVQGEVATWRRGALWGMNSILELPESLVSRYDADAKIVPTDNPEAQAVVEGLEPSPQ